MDGIVTGVFWLDWALLAVSLFNAMMLLWLGLTILLNADRQHWGVWLLGGGALAGALFFVSHTAILGQQRSLNFDGVNFWWQIGWIPVTIAPFAWYVLMLWYGGFWSSTDFRLRRRHQTAYRSLTFLAVLAVILLLIAKPVPSYEEVTQLDLSQAAVIGSVPVLFLFPVFMVGCILLSIDALRFLHAASSSDADLARQRSRPWLISASGILLLVSLFVFLFVGLVIFMAPQRALTTFSIQTIGAFDLVLSSLIAAATLMMGQAVVSYEVFTGRSLPRRNLFRQWRSLVILAAGYGVVVGWTLAAQIRPIYSLLLTTGVIVVFYALYTWRSFVERTRFMTNLRPFISTQNLVGSFLGQNGSMQGRAAGLLQAICREVLSTERAQLTPLGTLMPLVGKGLVYPPEISTPLMPPPKQLNTETLTLNPTVYGGYCWAIPLWTERGLSGALLIGSKQDGGVYSQEEIAIAQAAGERILDMLAGETMARSLIDLQRQRITQTRLIDLRTRRTLHDDVLPVIHATLLELSGTARAQVISPEIVHSLSDTHRRIADLIRDLPPLTPADAATSDLVGEIKRMMGAEFASAFAKIHWEINATHDADSLVQEIVLGAAREIVRNAAVHGRGEEANRAITLSIRLRRDEAFVIEIQDDGVGLGNAPLSTSGSGLALHSTLLALIGGTLTVENVPGGGTLARIKI